MTLFHRHAAGLSLALIVLAGASTAQNPQQDPSQTPHGKVIFSRSIDENGETVTEQSQSVVKPVNASQATDEERKATSATNFDLSVHLRPADQHIAVRAIFTVRNNSQSPLTKIPLQISSSLTWEQIRIHGKDVAFEVGTLNSDADHTGQLHEAVIALSTPLAPQSTLQLDATYSGTIQRSAQRLLAISTPESIALHSDWDEISTSFTGLRGFGNVVWYPTSSIPVVLGDGARLFDEIGEHKLSLNNSHFQMKLWVEYAANQAPTVAVINGTPVPLHLSGVSLPADVLATATAEVKDSILGLEPPSLFVAIRKPTSVENVTVWSRADNISSASLWTTAVKDVTPLLQRWLGQHPRTELTLLELPDNEDAPYEAGSTLVTSLTETTEEQMDSAVAHSLTHAWAHSPQAWLDEGIAHFIGTLWIEKQYGRGRALGMLESSRRALALAEPETPGKNEGQVLRAATSPLYYRTKAAYIFWMLRGSTSDGALSSALRAYCAGQDKSENAFEAQIKQTAGDQDIGWIFSDWIYNDKGLPNMTIDGAYSTATTAGNWMIAVHVNNDGNAAAEIPITVRSESAEVTQRVLVPAQGKAVQRILIQGKPTEVQVNDGAVPETEASVHVSKLIQVTASPTPAPPHGVIKPKH